jgi:hypothetical protein
MNEELKKEWESEMNTILDVYIYDFGEQDKLNIKNDTKSFISSLLAKHQEEIVKMVEDRQKVFDFIPHDKYGYKMVKSKDLDLLADIKSKLNI